MSTIRDVARVAGVSITTVSATINETAPVSQKARDRVWAAIETVGYSPDPVAQHLRSGRSTGIGLVLPDISTPYSAHLAKALHQALSRNGYRVMLSSNGHDPDTEIKDIESFVAHRVAGLVVVPTSLRRDDAARLTKAAKKPTVLVDRVIPGTSFDAVTDDNRLGAELIARYLLRLGNRDIAFFAGRPHVSPSDERLAGYIAAMAEANIDVRRDLIRSGVFTYAQALETVQQIMLLPDPPTALISINNAQTKGIMAGLKGMGLRAPRDVSLITFDGFHGSEGWDPAITSLHQDMDGISQRAADLLLERIGEGAKRKRPATTVRIAPTLTVRESCRQVGPSLI